MDRFEPPMQFRVVCVICGEFFWMENSDRIKPGYMLTRELACRCSEGKPRTCKIKVPVVLPSPWLVPATV